MNERKRVNDGYVSDDLLQLLGTVQSKPDVGGKPLKPQRQ
jgi:hypothetical protein